MGLDYHKSFSDYCSSSHRRFDFVSVSNSIEIYFTFNRICISSRRAKFEAELKAMQWLIKWEELITRTLLHNGVATPSFNKLSASQKVGHLRDHFDMLISFESSGFIHSEVSEYVSIYSKHHSLKNFLPIAEFARIFFLCLCFSPFFVLWNDSRRLFCIFSMKSYRYTYTEFFLHACFFVFEWIEWGLKHVFSCFHLAQFDCKSPFGG